MTPRWRALSLLLILGAGFAVHTATAVANEAADAVRDASSGKSAAPDAETVLREETPAATDAPPKDATGSDKATSAETAAAAAATPKTPVADSESTAASADAAAGGQTPAEAAVEPVGATIEPERTAQPVSTKQRARSGAQKFEFQAEVSRLMDIIINSLYSNKDIFLRELISNAADALDKIRFLSLTDKSQLGEGNDANLDIRISVDPDKKVLKIRDRGIGMTKDDLRNHLGTIAKSGTSAFLEQMQKGGDLNLIGQFGVGFYSVYLVADYVEVISKHNNDSQYIWESGADGAFAISEDTDGEPLGRGTQINIYLKEEAQEYAQEQKLKDLVAQYSGFINFPISLWTSKQVEREVPLTEEEMEKQELERQEQLDKKKAEDVADEEEDEEKEEEPLPTTKKVTETVQDWEQLNTQSAIWLRDPKDINKEEYDSFYQAISKNTYEKPMAHAHFKAEGDVEFKAILYLPGKAPPDFMDNYYQRKNSIKLYVRRVFISDDFEDLIPRYLRWLVGLVDSDTLPLNVSREMLQAHSSLKTIKKKLVRKALDMIRKIADAETAAKAEDEDDNKDNKEETEAGEDKEEAKTQYSKLWKEFGKALKMGIVEDTANRNRLAKLMRVVTSKSELSSLEEYVSRMKPDQKNILYIAGQSKEDVENSPFLEKLKRKDYEVIYFTDALDEYVMSNLQEFDGHKFFDVSKEDLKLGKDKADKAKDKKLKGEYKGLTKWWKEQLGSQVQGVKISKRLHTTPAVVVTSKFGWSANMERIMRSQAMGDAEKQAYMRGQRTLEINPYHPLIQELKSLHGNNAEGERPQLLAKLLYETALLESGFQIDDSKAFNKRIYGLVKDVLKIKKDLDQLDPEAEEAEKEEEADAEVEEADSGHPGPAAVNTDRAQQKPKDLATEDVRDEL